MPSLRFLILIITGFFFLILGTICDDACPEGTYGPNCMGICRCDSSQFVCDNIQGCMCQKGFAGDDCMTPRSAFQEMAGGEYQLKDLTFDIF